MLPRSYYFFKWTLYGAVTLLLFFLQGLVFDRLLPWPVTPFLYPLLPATVAALEGQRQGGIFSLVVGVICDLLLPGPFEGFYTIVFSVIGLLSAIIAENFLSRGLFCTITVSVMAMLLTGFSRALWSLLFPESYWLLMLYRSVTETVLTLPVLVLIWPLYQHLHRHFASEY